MATLLDQWERPIDLAALKREQAAPTLTGVRQILGGHPEQGLTPRRLAALLREAEDGDATRYLELAEAMEEKDLHYLSVIGTRKRAVAQLEITVEPASDSTADLAAAELVEKALGREELQDELVDILDAIGKGYSATEIVWETSERQWMPTRLEWRDPRWFRFDRADGRTLRLIGDSGQEEELAPFKFIVHLAKAKSGLPIRGGLARAAAWGYLFKNYDIKDWIGFIEVYGQPLRVGKYHPGATKEEKEILLRAVANIGSDAAAIVPQSMLIEFVDAASKGTSSVDLYERFANYIDKQVSKAVLGQTMTTDDGSSRAQAQVHDAVREDIERADAKQLSATLNRDLVRPLIDLNLGPQKAYPRLRIGRPEDEDIPALVDQVSKLVPMGLPVGKRAMLTKLGLSEPDADDELLSSPAAGPAAPGTPAPGAAAPAAQARARAGDEPSDSLDDLVETMLADEGWEALISPLVEPIREAAGEVDSLEALRDRLAALIQQMDTRLLEERLAQAGFVARLAGETGAPLSEAEDLTD